MKRNGNPYPKTITDEGSGTQVPNIAHRIWWEGYEAGRNEAIITEERQPAASEDFPSEEGEL